MATKKTGGLGETVRTIVYAVLIAFAVRTLAYEPFNIPSGSMMPTLLEGDYLFVSKFSYGYSRYTLAFGLPLFDGRILGSGPERGDVAVFRLPSDPSTDYIKRVIGLPGDRIQVTDGVLHINGEAVTLERVADDPELGPNGQTVNVPRYIETLPNGRQHYVLDRDPHGFLDNTPEFVVPPAHYFMMGDNRDNSLDSRTTQVGYVPEENLVGRAEFLWFSLADGAFWQIWRWPFELRFDRLFTAIR